MLNLDDSDVMSLLLSLQEDNGFPLCVCLSVCLTAVVEFC